MHVLNEERLRLLAAKVADATLEQLSQPIQSDVALIRAQLPTKADADKQVAWDMKYVKNRQQQLSKKHEQVSNSTLSQVLQPRGLVSILWNPRALESKAVLESVNCGFDPRQGTEFTRRWMDENCRIIVLSPDDKVSASLPEFNAFMSQKQADASCTQLIGEQKHVEANVQRFVSMSNEVFRLGGGFFEPQVHRRGD